MNAITQQTPAYDMSALLSGWEDELASWKGRNRVPYPDYRDLDALVAVLKLDEADLSVETLLVCAFADRAMEAKRPRASLPGLCRWYFRNDRINLSEEGRDRVERRARAELEALLAEDWRRAKRLTDESPLL